MENYISLINNYYKNINVFKYLDKYYFFDIKHIKAYETDKTVFDYFNLSTHSESSENFINVYGKNIYDEVVEEISTIINLNSKCGVEKKDCASNCAESKNDIIKIEIKTFIVNKLSKTNFEKIKLIINSIFSFYNSPYYSINLVFDGDDSFEDVKSLKNKLNQFGNKIAYVVKLNIKDSLDEKNIKNYLKININPRIIINDSELYSLGNDYGRLSQKYNLVTEIILSKNINLTQTLIKINELKIKKIDFSLKENDSFSDYVHNIIAISEEYLKNIVSEKNNIQILNILNKIYQLHYSQSSKKRSLLLSFDVDGQLFLTDGLLDEKISVGNSTNELNEVILKSIESLFNSSLNQCEHCWVKQICGGGRLFDVVGENLSIKNRDQQICNSIKNQFEMLIHFHTQLSLIKPDLLPRSKNNSKAIELKLKSDKYKITLVNP